MRPPSNERASAFLLTAEQTVRRDVAGGAREADAQPGDHLFLVLAGASPLAGGARWSLAGIDEVRFRRGSTRAAERESEGGRRILAIKLPDGLISSSHARLVRASGGFTLVDDGSTNGTFVDGARVTARVLLDGAGFELGATHFMLRLAIATPGGTADDLESASLLGSAFGVASLLPDYAADLGDLARIARTELSILLLGESGAGKEVLAAAVHRLSGRTGPFVGVNCGALTPTLMESQLFGHVKGAFSGAVSDEPGFVRASNGGTLFLDEIGDLPATSQATLLRVLETREVVPVGSTRAVPVDLRVVSATLKPEDALRPDLRARLAGFTHRLPPLRERMEDFGIILATLLARGAGERAATLKLEPEAGRALLAHDWPLNVREVKQSLGVALALVDGPNLACKHFPESIFTGVESAASVESAGSVDRAASVASVPGSPASADRAPREPALSPAVVIPKDDASLRALLVATLEQHRGNVSEVSRALGRTRMQIHRWMRRVDLDPQAFRT